VRGGGWFSRRRRGVGGIISGGERGGRLGRGSGGLGPKGLAADIENGTKGCI